MTMEGAPLLGQDGNIVDDTVLTTNGEYDYVSIQEIPPKAAVAGSSSRGVEDSGGGGIRHGRGRLDSLDLLRGLIVAIMAWDHCKDFLASYTGQDGTSPDSSNAGTFGTHTETYAGPLEMFSGLPVYFLSRFVSHMCAPGFSFLMGAGMIMLRESRMRKYDWTAARVCRFFVARGFILILLGFVVRAAFLILLIDPTPEMAYRMKRSSPVIADLFGFFQVMTLLGLSMIAASPLVSMLLPRLDKNEHSPPEPEPREIPLLESESGRSDQLEQLPPEHNERVKVATHPVRRTGLICISLASAMLAAEQLIIWSAQGPVPAEAQMTDATSFPEILLRFTFVPGAFDTLPSQNYYPFVPWLAVCLLGVAYGAALIRYKDRAVRASGLVGVGLLAAFVLVRLFGGRVFSTRGWPLHEGREYPFISFLNVCKYPPSAAFVLLTVGLNLLLLCGLALIRRPDGNAITRSLLAFGRAPLVFYVLHFYVITTLIVVLYAVAGVHGMPLGLVPVVWIGLLALMSVICTRYASFKEKTAVDSIWRFF